MEHGNKLGVVSFDPSMSNFGICEALVNLEDYSFEPVKLTLISTEREETKTVIKTSDDLRRARIVLEAMHRACEGKAIAFSEIPLGTASKYANAILNSGMMVGILASCPIPLIEMSPKEVKEATIGFRNAQKEEMIEWGLSRYPNVPGWLFHMRKGKQVPNKDNEHLADALAVMEAGVQDFRFKQATSVLRTHMLGMKQHA